MSSFWFLCLKASDGPQQKPITGFFASAGVLSSSPQKGNTVKTERGLNNHIIVKGEEEERNIVMDIMEGITEEMFVDDEEFGTGMCTVKEEENEQEGTGAGCSSWVTPSRSSFVNSCVEKEEEEDEEYDVQSLPDAHYGLLGLNRPLLEPQGHIQDLPEELLGVIFARLPADDLYHHVSLVCRRWRGIVMDDQVCFFYIQIVVFFPLQNYEVSFLL